MTQISLSWNAYNQSICSGLSQLQQNSEFVDMTIAADGHHVKVHQMILSLCSPYIKELITSTKSSHPIIILNKVSYSTLCALLEYIYTGEVLISKESLTDVIQTAKELHIQGLEDITLDKKSSIDESLSLRNNWDEEEIFKNVKNIHNQKEKLPERACHYYLYQEDDTTTKGTGTPKKKSQETSIFIDADQTAFQLDQSVSMETDTVNSKHIADTLGIIKDNQVQYTLSNQGSIQLILNRYIYNLRYTSRKGATEGHRHWRCVEYVRRLKCPAAVFTKDDVVIKRLSAHNHPFHDKKILKKVQDEAVYSAVHEAETLGKDMKLKRQNQEVSELTIL